MQSPTAPLNPWIYIWVRPRETIRQIVNAAPDYLVIPLAVMAGLAQALDKAIGRSYGDDFPWPILLFMLIIFGGLGGIASLYIGGAVFRWAGSKLGGVATSEEVRAAIAWSSVPQIIIIGLILIHIFIYRGEAFTSQTPKMDAFTEQNLAFSLLFLVFNISFLAISVVMGIWNLVILSKTLGEVHGFSAWRGLATYLIPGIVMLVLVLVYVIASQAIYSGP